MRLSLPLRTALLVAIIGSLALLAPAHAAPARGHRPNAIVIENQHPGSDLWRLPWPGFQVADDVGLQIKGFAARVTTHPGGEVALKVTVTPAQDFTVDVLRLGFYGGLGARLMKHIDWTHGV